jgi:Fission yeast centromere protein N-terminal domain/Tc5 transposase DNA-binding domain
MAPPSKRSAYSDADKQSLRAYARQNPTYKQHELLNWAQSHLNGSNNITQGMISKWLSSRYEYLDSPTALTARMDSGKVFLPNRKKRRTEAFPIIELALYEWHCRAERKIILSGNGLIERAKRFWIALAPIHYPNTEEPKWSPGWLAGFKTRFGIQFRAQHGELGSALLLDVELEIVRMMSPSFNPFVNIYFIRQPS